MWPESPIDVLARSVTLMGLLQVEGRLDLWSPYLSLPLLQKGGPLGIKGPTVIIAPPFTLQAQMLSRGRETRSRCCPAPPRGCRVKKESGAARCGGWGG